MKILVTGAAGFLGSNLVQRLVTEGNDVVGVDNLLTGKLHNLDKCILATNFTFYDADIIKLAEDLKPGFQQIYHLASPASPPKYMQHEYETMMVNTLATEKLARYCMSNNARLLFSSTSEVYGDPLVNPQSETYFGNVNPIGPRSIYDESKRFGETLIAHFNRTQQLDSIIIRIFNTYGPGMDPYDGRVVTNFIRQMLMGEPVTIYGDGSQTRSFCYVDDLITGMILAMNSSQIGPINLGNPNEFTLTTLVKIIASKIGVEPQLKFEQLPTDDPKVRRPDIANARALLGWEPEIQLEVGIDKTLQWIRTAIEA